MTLYQLVYLRNQLRRAFDSSVISEEINKNYNRLLIVAEDTESNVEQEIKDKIINVANIHKESYRLSEQTSQDIANILEIIQKKIDNLAFELFENNYQTELRFYNTSIEYIRSVHKIASNEQFESTILQRINLHSNWQFPALEIGCRDGEWTKYLVASDPLYISDVLPEFLNSSLEQFPDLYKGRVRKYLIKDRHVIHNLPSKQFGLIFSYNFFNYLSLDSIKQWLIQSFDWLKDGGKILFTYNNADLSAAASYAETYFMTFVPKSILQPMAESLGFETSFSFDMEPAFSIIEFKKPGQLKSTKLSQTLGEIKYKN